MGEFRTIFGQLCHIMKASRPDISNAVNRLGIFQSTPNKLAFESVYRVLQYLNTHPNVPLVYPRPNFKLLLVYKCILAMVLLLIRSRYHTAFVGMLISLLRLTRSFATLLGLFQKPHQFFRCFG